VQRANSGRAATAILVIVLLAACARLGAGGAASPGGDSPTLTAAKLAGTWLLLHGTGPGGDIRVPDGRQVTIAFEGDRVSGSACNIYGGTYRLEDGGMLRFAEMAMTEMACEEPMMSLEAAYHAALTLVRTASLSGDRLTLTGDGAELVFERQQPTPTAALVETHWNLEMLIQGEAASSVIGKAWLILNRDGTLAGSTGCRDFSGNYVKTAPRLTIEALVNSDQACPQATAAQDRQVLAVLSADPDVEIDGDRLTLTGHAVAGLGYRAAAR